MSKVLITGGTSGIGKALAIRLRHEGHDVVITARNERKAIKMLESMRKKHPEIRISWLPGDLSTIDSCYTLAGKIKKLHPDTDTLINNAGVWMTKKELNEDGLEMSFMVNYLAPFILSRELLNILEKNAPARIININAGLYVTGKVDPEKTPYGHDFHPIKSYANSKACGIMAVIDLADQFKDTGVTINAIHPGVIRTKLGSSNHPLSKIISMLKLFWSRPSTGALAPAWLATSPEVAHKNGNFFNKRKETEFSDHVKDRSLRDQLRSVTLEILDRQKNRKV